MAARNKAQRQVVKQDAEQGDGASETADPGELVAEFAKNGREQLRVRLTKFKGLSLVDIRAFYRVGDEWKPGKGLSIRRGKIGKLKAALALIPDEPDPDDL